MDKSRSQGIGRLAGAFWLGGVAVYVPIALASGGAAGSALAVAVASGLCGALCFAVPWGSIATGWLHAPSIAASLGVATAVATGGTDGSTFSWLIVGVALYAALAFEARRAIVAELGFAGLALTVACLAPAEGAGLATLAAALPVSLVVALTVTVQRERLETNSQRDPLTGIGNYKVLSERLQYEILRHERHRRAFTVMLLDLDRFKLVNDRYGHLEGDRLLRSVARVLKKSVRDQDTVARQGGDEFSVLLPETGDQGTAIVARKIEASLAQMLIAGSPLRASIGWAVFPQDGRSPDALLTAADVRQRAAKHAGRRSRTGVGVGASERVAA